MTVTAGLPLDFTFEVHVEGVDIRDVAGSRVQNNLKESCNSRDVILLFLVSKLASPPSQGSFLIGL
uniref:Uncharacterized protein n=1 Tax=Lepeophtheirus salmonis TaxID=72036 RepID=A0A0K2TTW4_LEPSM